MDRLVELNASGENCGINDEGIQKVNLIVLHASNNKYITNVNHMQKTLGKLYARNNYGIHNKGMHKT
jgi:hypothetical protein